MRGKRTRRWLSVTGLLVALTGVGLAAPGTAAAAPIPGLARHAFTVPGGAGFAAATVSCPTPHVVYGLGGEIHNGNGEVHMVSLLPNAALTAVTVIAAPRVAPVAPWRLTAYAICGRDVPATPHLEVNPVASWVDVETCNGASRLYGTGARQTGGPAATLREMVPNAPAFPPIAVRASVNPPAGAPGVAAAAICGIPQPTLHSIVAPAAGFGSTVTCPAGELVHGTGGLVPGVNPNIVFEGIVPNLALTQVRVTARNGGTGLPEPTVAFAVCA
ncbi:MAG TPA: hypothetical protein VFV67_11870 [Actinophytocola sp.]|uniref:hypothetical protein n=1 Tax=Actinophytocola sp. TaxID=1872138 RepID=UPI002DB95FE0|nr:hypothetical protein [Actinophytocola sp.]HEU5471343.1 hypothetical protein [Actinophytocola sp.]